MSAQLVTIKDFYIPFLQFDFWKAVGHPEGDYQTSGGYDRLELDPSKTSLDARVEKLLQEGKPGPAVEKLLKILDNSKCGNLIGKIVQIAAKAIEFMKDAGYHSDAKLLQLNIQPPQSEDKARQKPQPALHIVPPRPNGPAPRLH